MHRTRDIVRGTWAVIFAAGCLGSLQLSAQSVRDSAGIQIVENAKPLWTAQQALHLSKTPALVIGTQDGEAYEFSAIKGAARLSGGRFAVADERSRQIRFFDSTGRHTKTVGGKGQGPGEFDSDLDRLTVLPGDTLVGLHYNGFRIVSLFTGMGNFVTQLNLSFTPPKLGQRPPPRQRVQETLSGMLRVVQEYANPLDRPAGTHWIHTAQISIVDRDNKVVTTLGEFPVGHYEMREHPEYLWLGSTGQFASFGNTFYFGFGDDYSVRVYTAQGNLSRILHRQWTASPITKADINTFTTEWSKRWANKPGPEGDKERADIRSAPYATKVPAFTQLIADRVGRLWVREAHLADAPRAGNMSTSPLVPTAWSVFDTSGKWLCDVTMPAFFLPTDIGSNYVVGVARDADGVQTVAMYSLTPGGTK